MLDVRELIRRVGLGDGIRRVARDMGVSRKTVAKYLEWATGQGGDELLGHRHARRQDERGNKGHGKSRRKLRNHTTRGQNHRNPPWPTPETGSTAIRSDILILAPREELTRSTPRSGVSRAASCLPLYRNARSVSIEKLALMQMFNAAMWAKRTRVVRSVLFSSGGHEWPAEKRHCSAR